VWSAMVGRAVPDRASNRTLLLVTALQGGYDSLKEPQFSMHDTIDKTPVGEQAGSLLHWLPGPNMALTGNYLIGNSDEMR
jgi:hypothetical protein